MLDQLLIARSYLEIDRVDLVRAGELNCGSRALFSGFFKQLARARRNGLDWLRLRAAAS